MSNIEDDVNNLGAFCLANIIGIISQEEFEDVKKSIKNILSEREQLLKEKKDDKQDIKDFQNALNEENLRCANYAIENNELKKRIKELEAKLEFKKYGDLDEIEFEEYMSHFIPKQKVKDKIEEVKLSGGGNGKDNVENLARELVIDVLEELLEEGE